MMFSFRSHLILPLFVLAVLRAGTAAAFFPDFSAWLSKMEEQLGGVRTLQVELSFPEEPGLQCLLWIKGDSWRQEWIKSKDNRPGTVAAAAIGKGSSLQAIYSQGEGFPLPVTFFWYHPEIRRLWAAQGIETKHVAYRFLDETPCVVFGAWRQLTDRPQVWFHLEEYVPVRLKMENGVVWTWTGYHNIGNFFIPHAARVEFDSEPVLEMTLSWRGINREIPDSLFDGSAFNQKFSQAPAPKDAPEPFALLGRQLNASH